MFPWGGQAIIRNHYEQNNGLWMWFDTGNTYGSSGHAHCSKNAINLRVNGTMLLVDSGRFQYNGQGLSEKLNREYERTTTAHNSLTFDGKEQASEPHVATTPAPNSTWNFTTKSDFASGSSSLSSASALPARTCAQQSENRMDHQSARQCLAKVPEASVGFVA